ncbi:MAG: hypothetical protein RLZZ191_1515 [Pseudomonadota bacterium]
MGQFSMKICASTGSLLGDNQQRVHQAVHCYPSLGRFGLESLALLMSGGLVSPAAIAKIDRRITAYNAMLQVLNRKAR